MEELIDMEDTKEMRPSKSTGSMQYKLSETKAACAGFARYERRSRHMLSSLTQNLSQIDITTCK